MKGLVTNGRENKTEKWISFHAFLTWTLEKYFYKQKKEGWEFKVHLSKTAVLSSFVDLSWTFSLPRHPSVLQTFSLCSES